MKFLSFHVPIKAIPAQRYTSNLDKDPYIFDRLFFNIDERITSQRRRPSLPKAVLYFKEGFSFTLSVSSRDFVSVYHNSIVVFYDGLLLYLFQEVVTTRIYWLEFFGKQ